jgi:hypothetical protein
MASNNTIASKHCANYGKGEYNGVCSGVMIAPNGFLFVDVDYQGKKCFADQKCSYFNSIVMGGIIYAKNKKK